MKDLTPRQKKVLDIIQLEKDKSGAEPTISMIAEKLQINFNGALGHITALERKGFINKVSRGGTSYIKLADDSLDEPAPHEIPMVGIIAAGPAKESFENNETLDLSRHSFGKEIYALKVSGQSMSEDGIFDGDSVLISTQSLNLNDKTIFAVRVNQNEVTLKRIKKTKIQNKEFLDLIPSNKTFKVMRHPLEEVEVIGKIAGLIRRY